MSDETHTARLLGPAHQAIEGARMALLLVSLGIVLVLGGAKLERYLIKRQLQVVDSYADGHAEGERTARWAAEQEGTGGGRA